MRGPHRGIICPHCGREILDDTEDGTTMILAYIGGLALEILVVYALLRYVPGLLELFP